MMENSKSTKRALLTSVLALLMCVAMLVGATFAWFTDTASTGINKIQAGNLDVELEYKNSDTAEFTKADKNTEVFKEGALWEPGHVEYVVLRVSNAGSLALKYKLGINIANEVGSTNVYGNAFNLSDYIRFAVLDGDRTVDSVDRDALVAAATDSKLIKEGYTAENHLLPASTDNSQKVVTLVVWMPTTVGNEANYKKGAAAPSIDLGINVVATQDTYENDSFDDQYDTAAVYPALNWDELKAAATNGGSVTLGGGITVTPVVENKNEQTLVTQMEITKDTRLNLSGKKIGVSAPPEGFGKATPVLMTVSGGTLTIDGDGEISCEAGEEQVYGINILGGKVVINGGKHYGAITAVQVQRGSLEINGGFFDMAPTCKAQVPKYAKYVVNCIDQAYKDGTATISIKGGIFVNFDPSDNPEGAGTSYVAAGYKVVSKPQTNGDVWYTVVPK